MNNLQSIIYLFIRSSFFILFLFLCLNGLLFFVGYFYHKHKKRIENKFIAYLLRDSIFLVLAQVLLNSVKLNEFLKKQLACEAKPEKNSIEIITPSTHIFESLKKIHHHFFIKRGKIFFKFK